MQTKPPESQFTRILWPLFAFVLSAGIGEEIATRPATKVKSLAGARQTASAKSASAPSDGRIDAFASEEKMLTTIMSALAEKEPLQRSHQLYEAIGKLDSAELSVLFGKAVKIEDNDRRKALISALLTQWFRIDPESARIAVRPYQDRFRSAMRIEEPSLDAAINCTLASLLPEETLAEAMANPDAAWARDVAGIALSSFPASDPTGQLEILARFPDNPLRSKLGLVAIKALAKKDGPAAEAYLKLWPDQRERMQVYADIMGMIAERDPAAALARLATLDPGLLTGVTGTRLVTEALQGVSKNDPAAALAAANGLPENLRGTAIGSVLVAWADQNPVDALSWGSANGINLAEAKGFMNFGENRVSMRMLMVMAFARDREKTMDWICSQPASAERDAMLQSGIRSGSMEQRFQLYSELTPAGQASAATELVRASFESGSDSVSKAQDWMRDLPPGPARVAAIKAFTEVEVGNPDRFTEIAQSWPPGPDRDAANRVFVQSLASQDSSRALEFARQITSPAMRESAFEEIAYRWLSKDKAVARAWITTAPELTVEQKRVLLKSADAR